MKKETIYDIQNTNLALFGSDVEYEIKKTSATKELSWKDSEKEGLKIWRIVNFQVTAWDPNLYGKFYDGDSYIVLNVYKPMKNSDKLAYDAHFWIGSASTADEYGTAAYKTVELDTYLDDKAIQYREIQGHESNLFLSYFDQIIILSGGADSGFNQVKPEKYCSRLLHFHGLKRNIRVTEVLPSKHSLDITDAFILDEGMLISIWYGRECNTGERVKAMVFANKLAQERYNVKVVVFESGDDREFIRKLSDDVVSAEQQHSHLKDEIYKVSNESGRIEYTNLNIERLSRDYLDTNDVFIINHSSGVYVWIGKGANQCEKRNGISYAQKYIHGIPDKLKPITIVKEGLENPIFDELFQQ